MPRIVAGGLIERHHDPLKGQALFAQGDLDLAGETG
jgi:hypothetical protein